MKYPKTQTQHYTVWTYDLWGPKGEKTVNDCFEHRTFTLKVKGTVYNKDTPNEFVAYEPTDRQLNYNVGTPGATWDGESDYTLYATDRHGDPVCELRRIK